MATKIILKKEQLAKTSYSGSMHESKILGFPKENSPQKPYSSIFYWSHMSSDFGSVITEHPIIGFEILNYVVKGKYDSYDKKNDKWTNLKRGDIQIIQAGKGIRYSGKLHPLSEMIQIWLDPDFNVYRKIDPVLSRYSAEKITIDTMDKDDENAFISNKSSIKLNSKDVAIHVVNLAAGFHDIPCPKDTVLSGSLLEGYIEINETLLGVNDYFRFDGKKNLKIASLTNSKIFLIASPLKPEYQTYAEMQF